MQDVAQMAGGAQASGQDALTKLDTTLRPIEKYAVRFLEMVRSLHTMLVTFLEQSSACTFHARCHGMLHTASGQNARADGVAHQSDGDLLHRASVYFVKRPVLTQLMH